MEQIPFIDDLPIQSWDFFLAPPRSVPGAQWWTAAAPRNSSLSAVSWVPSTWNPKLSSGFSGFSSFSHDNCYKLLMKSCFFLGYKAQKSPNIQWCSVTFQEIPFWDIPQFETKPCQGEIHQQWSNILKKMWSNMMRPFKTKRPVPFNLKETPKKLGRVVKTVKPCVSTPRP